MKDNSFFEILTGKSRLLPETGGVFFYKHPTVFELESFGEMKEKIYLQGQKDGLKTEEELLNDAIELDLWSDAKTEEIKQLKWLVKRQELSLQKMSDQGLINEFENKIKESKREYEELEAERESITRFSLENFVERRSNNFLYQRFLFHDEECSQPILELEIKSAIVKFQEKYTQLSDLNKTLWRCYDPAFWDIFLLSDQQPLQVFGKNIYDITIFQKNMLLCARILKNKLEYPNLPDSVRENPVSLYNYDPNKKQVEEKGFNIREDVKRRGGEKNLKAEDYLT